MNFRATAILFGAVGVLVIALLVVALTEGQPRVGGGLVEPLTRAAMAPKDVETVELVRTEPTEQKLVFVRTGETSWELREPVTAKMDGGQIAAVIKALFDAQPVPHPDMSPSLAVLGLEKPTLKVTLKASDKSVTVNLGNSTIGGDRAVTFVTASDRPQQPMAVRRSDLAPLFLATARNAEGPAAPGAKWLTDYRSRRLIGSEIRDPVSDVKEIALRTGGKLLVLARGKVGSGTWVFRSPPSYGLADVGGDPNAATNLEVFTGVRMLLNAITNLQPGNNDDYIENPGDLAQYGLTSSDPKVIGIRLTPEKGKEEILFLGKAVEENGKPVVPPKVYGRLEGDSAVVKLPTDMVEKLRRTILDPAPLRNRDLFAEGSREKIDALDIQTGGQTVKLRRVPLGPSPKWVLYGSSNPQEASQIAVETLIGTLTRLRNASEVLEKLNDAAFAPAERKAEIKVWQNGVPRSVKSDTAKPPPEPTLAGEPVTIIVGKKEGDRVYVRRVAEGQTTDFKFAESLIPTVTRGRLEYLDPSFQSFAGTLANKLTIAVAGGKTTEIAKDKSDKWIYAQPTELKGKEADPAKVLSLLGSIATWRPEKVLAESASPEDLKKFGLEPARVRVTVGLPDNVDRVYLLGADTPETGYIYAKQESQTPVVQLLKAATVRLTTDDLRDFTVYRLDPEKVGGFKIRGWLKDGKQTELLFEKQVNGDWKGTETTLENKGGQWTPTGPAKDYPTDAAKLIRFLKAVSAPKATQMIHAEAKNYGLTEGQPDRLEVTLGPPPTVLILGSQANPDARYADSSAIPRNAQELMILPSTEINALTKDPSAFRK